MINGIDVSDRQPLSPNTTGQSFILVKASEGRTYLNPRQAAQAAHGRLGGLHVGFYHFLWPGNIAAQAAFFVDRCASIAGDSLWCDWETTENGTSATCAEKDQFLAEVKRLRPGHMVGLYCNRDYWLTHDTTSHAGDGLWIADPSAPEGHPRIRAPWLIHQYGESNGTDQNVAQFESADMMIRWARTRISSNPKRVVPAPPAPPEPTYRVEAGDTLSAIAERFDTTVPALVSLNKIADPNHIEVGQILKLR